MEGVKTKVDRREALIGFVIILLVVFGGKNFLSTDMLFFRLLIGTGLGYSLSRAYMGFAGSVNRAFTTGSTKLMRTLMYMFFITAVITTAFVFNDVSQYNLWINPINLGLILGAMLFGFGMSFSECCASGVLTDLVTALPRAIITLVFFSLGVFLGFPLQKKPLVTESWFSTKVGEQMAGGVYLPDLFPGDGLRGYLGAILLTGLFCGIVVLISYLYEKRRKEANTFTGVGAEEQEKELKPLDPKELEGDSVYHSVFVKPWTQKQGAVALALLFALLMGVTKAGWGASTPLGMWFGKLLMLFGVEAESLAAYTGQAVEFFTVPFFEHGVSVQNFGIVVGTMIYLFTAGKFKETFFSEMHINLKDFLIFAVGGLTMGVGTRLANGCNVGALYTPIANLSLSGWVFLVFMVVGAVAGNTLKKKVR